FGEELAQRFDDGLEFAQQLVYNQADFVVTRMDDDDVFAPARGTADTELVAQPHEGQHFATQVEIASTVCHLGRFGRHFHALKDCIQRHHVRGPSNRGKKAVDNCKGQWKTHAYGGTQAFFAIKVDRAAQGFNILAHHVHAHSASRQVGHAICGRESRLENQVADFSVGKRVARANHAALNSLGANLVYVQSPAVITDFNDDVAGVVISIEAHHTLRRLSPGHARGFRLNAMVDGIAHQVGQRVADLFHHRLVQLGVGTLDLQDNVLAELFADITHYALEALERLADFHHTKAQGALADVLDITVDTGSCFLQGSIAELSGKQSTRGAGDDQFTHQVDQLVELFGINANEAGGLAAGCLGPSSVRCGAGSLRCRQCLTG